MLSGLWSLDITREERMLANMIKSIMTTDIASLALGTSLKKAIKLMSQKNISCVVINEENKPVGIITERDVLKIAAKNKSFDNLKVEDVMISPVKTVSKNMDVYEAAIYLEQNHFRRIVIVDENGKLLGLVTQTDLQNHLGAVYYVKLKTIESIMSKSVVTAGLNESLLKIIERMFQNDISCLVICQRNKPVGIITERDVTHLMADSKDPAGLKAKDFANRSLVCISKDASIYEATKHMKKRNIRRLVVVGDKKELVGLVAETDIVKHLEIDYLEFLRNIVERDRTYIDTIKEGLFECTPSVDGIFTWINQAGAEVLGYSAPEKVIGQRIKDVFVNHEDLKELMELMVSNGVANDFNARLKKRNGKEIYAEGTFYFVKDEEDNICCMEGTLRDVSERKKMEEKINKHSAELELKVKQRTAEIRKKNKELERINAKLEALSVQDGLTGLKNFRYFSQVLEMEFEKAKRYQTPLSCIILDVDDFKFINDRFGHTAGDLALKKTARLLNSLVRNTDVVARYGGDEFTLILPNTDIEKAVLVGNKILEAFRKYDFKKGALKLGKISLSIGISAMDYEKIKTHQQLLEYADKAMYRAKEHGKNNVCSCLELN